MASEPAMYSTSRTKSNISDDYYLFEGIDKLPPSAYSLSSFTPDTNLVASVFRLQGHQPVVELASELSGISLCFQTNR